MPDITVVSPSYCERDNIPLLFERLKAALGARDWELLVVDDDSPDGTAEAARAIAQQDRRLRIIQRLDRRGLSGAVVEGILASSPPILVVIDADLQHDETKIPDMLDLMAKQRDVQLVVGTRYIEGGGAGGLDATRLKMSRLATWLGNLVSGTPVSDPMSGFFAIRREVFMTVANELSGQGFKILLDILASSRPPLKIGEVPYTFGRREHGQSKLDSAVLWQYGELLLDKTVGRFVPVRLIKFGAVGTLGLLVHFAVLFSVFKLAGLAFVYGQAAATFVAMTWNYFLNNVFTFKDKRLTGWRSLLGLLSFYLVCSVGALANVGVAAYMFQQQSGWWLAGLAGVAVGMVWNYAVSSRITWGRRR
jgi:dolichol-phosphate mannosyltransferase